jgi:flagellar biosynthesis component FlhA
MVAARPYLGTIVTDLLRLSGGFLSGMDGMYVLEIRSSLRFPQFPFVLLNAAMLLLMLAIAGQ